MPLTWNVRRWLRGRSIKLRLRRRAKKSFLPVERLEQRLVPVATGSVTGTAFIDANGNGIRDFIDTNDNDTQDAGEVDEFVAKGVTLRLFKVEGATSTQVATTKSDDNGEFSFTFVPDGTYKLQADASTIVTGASTATFTVSGTEVEREFGVGSIAASALSWRSFLNSSPPANTREAFAFTTGGTGQTTAENQAPILKSGHGTAADPIAVNVAENASATFIDLIGNPSNPAAGDIAPVFDDPNFVNSQVMIQTNHGNINVNLFDKETPLTVANFYSYANAGDYNNSIFHRLAAGFVLQGGGFKYDATAKSITAIDKRPTDDPGIDNEFPTSAEDSRSNLSGTIAMAKLGGDPNSATNQFFFNLANNSSNLDNQNGGFTVFGQLVGADDFDVVQEMSTVASTSAGIKPYNASNATGIASSVRSALDNLPLDGYTKGTAAASGAANPNDLVSSTFPADSTAANFLSITGVTTTVRDEALTFTVQSNSNSDLVTATVVNNRLKLVYGQNKAGSADIVVRATDSHDPSNPLFVEATFHVVVTPDNTASPVFTSSANPSVTENSTSVLTVTATDADVPAQTVTYSIVGGADQTKFNITSNGVLTFVDPPDRENPTDANLDNVYIVQVQADDGLGRTTVQTINVTVTNANEAPTITSNGGGPTANVDVDENQTAVTTVIGDDVDAGDTLTYSISGDDADLFEIDPDTGVLTFQSAPIFGVNLDENGDGVYEVTVKATDGGGLFAEQALSVTVRDV